MSTRDEARARVHARLLSALDSVGYVDSTPDGIARQAHLDAIIDAVLGAGLPDHEAWPDNALGRDSEIEVRGESHGWIQWKGTQVCMDVHCRCGHHGHIDEEFAYFYRCPGCAGVFAIGATVHLYKMSDAYVAAAAPECATPGT